MLSQAVEAGIASCVCACQCVCVCGMQVSEVHMHHENVHTPTHKPHTPNCTPSPGTPPLHGSRTPLTTRVAHSLPFFATSHSLPFSWRAASSSAPGQPELLLAKVRPQKRHSFPVLQYLGPCAQIAAWPAVGVEGVRECCREHRQNVRDDAIALSSRCRALRVCRPMHTQPTLLHRVLLLSRFGRWKFEWEGFKSPGSSKKMIYFCFWRNRLRIFCTVRKFDGGSLY